MKKGSKILSLVFAMLFSLAIFAGCAETTKTMTDREGNEFTLPKKVEKIISTAPSNTEVLVDLGLADKLVAVDKYSADVEGINKDLPKIDFRNPDAETIISLQPDIIIASGHNKVGDNDPFQLVKDAGITVVYIPSSYSIDGIYGDIEFIAQITKADKKSKEIIDNMKKEVESIKAIGDKITNKKKVYFEIGSGSMLSSFGKETFLNEMIEIVGAENIFANEKSWISPSTEAIISANPDVILTSMPDINGVKAVDDIKSRDGWGSITAIKEGKVYSIDGNSSSRPSQNIIKALKEMAKAIYPNEYK
ncbi:iron chelate uptake ABC transporter FeCT family, solute-binding protein [Clostridium sartagoforme AAU1]|uniref:Iron chelate uptake ABC transporter FeCT family, solute-binding protein n=1 Tax=Clostridium sartagoforme AAU1 TaxID=1202534 RepID=R9CEP0_9CLOT|nr:ABC transporter substrate-binding protein [Clostridium sartagoforme]EOR27809.1 iron chelate uptake ABC transporter FeCT family, solute-binding protein [Clostridium sartagoforme AAU1]